MKKFFALMASAVISAGAFAQLPNGSVAPDFTATDINGVEHNLYSLLDQGYKVILDFSATWCGPCWSYHEAGTLSELYNTYGPDGTDEIRVFYLEADDTTTDADLNGTGTNTQGDWVTGTPYTIIDNAGSIFDDYDGAYYPPFTPCAQAASSPSLDRLQWRTTRPFSRPTAALQPLCPTTEPSWVTPVKLWPAATPPSLWR